MHTLVVGIANQRHVNRLPPTVTKDSQDIYKLVVDPNHCGYLPDNVQLLLDGQATQGALRQVLADVEAMVPEALSHGSFFFADIQQNQVVAAGLALLRFLAAQEEGTVISRETVARHFPPDELDRTLDLLTRRELIEPVGEGYRFQVELIRRWFARQVE